MKRLIMIGCALTLSLIATSAFATASFTSNGGSANNTTGVLKEFKTSKNVTLLVKASDQSYAAKSKHENGNRTFGSASGDPLIYYNESTAVGTALTSADLTASDSSAFSGWSSL